MGQIVIKKAEKLTRLANYYDNKGKFALANQCDRELKKLAWVQLSTKVLPYLLKGFSWAMNAATVAEMFKGNPKAVKGKVGKTIQVLQQAKNIAGSPQVQQMMAKATEALKNIPPDKQKLNAESIKQLQAAIAQVQAQAKQAPQQQQQSQQRQPQQQPQQQQQQQQPPVNWEAKYKQLQKQKQQMQQKYKNRQMKDQFRAQQKNPKAVAKIQSRLKKLKAQLELGK